MSNDNEYLEKAWEVEYDHKQYEYWFNRKKKYRGKRKDKLYLYNKYWVDYYSSKPRYEHEAWKLRFTKRVYKEVRICRDWVINCVDMDKSKYIWMYTEPSRPVMPKKRKGQLCLYEAYSPWSQSPKWWDKKTNLRPVRRKAKKFCRDMLYWNNEDVYDHPWYGAVQPSYRHVEYWD